MKKLTAIILAIMMISTMGFAAEFKSEADELYELGLFRGTENGYELDEHFTRAQGATMLVRLLGEEEKALSIAPKGKLNDVPADDWAAPYIEYCYDNQITKGTGSNNYSPEDIMSGAEYMTLVLRALGYKYAEPENVDIAAAEYALMSSVTARTIVSMPKLSRDYMVYISHCALTTKMLSGETLIESLADSDAVDKKTAEKLGLMK